VDGSYDLVVTQQSKPFYRAPSHCEPVHITVVPLALGPPTVTSAGAFQFGIFGNFAGKTNVIEASTDLIDWQPVGTNVATANSFLYLDTDATNFSRRFYRVQMLR